MQRCSLALANELSEMSEVAEVTVSGGQNLPFVSFCPSNCSQEISLNPFDSSVSFGIIVYSDYGSRWHEFPDAL